MPIIDIIFQNNLTYQQGAFANNLTRGNILDLANKINDNSQTERNTSVYNFIYNTLMWGNFDLVVGRYHNVTAQNILENINDFNQYSKRFIAILDKNNPADIFNSFKYGELKIKNVGESYFTKFMHFYSYGKNQKNKFIIIDKWIKIAWAALVFELNFNNSHEIAIQSIKRNKSKYSVSSFNVAKFLQCSQDLRTIADLHQIELSRFEELIFGWDLRVEIAGLINPRFEMMNILDQHL